MLGEMDELFPGLLPVHLPEQHPIQLLRADQPLQYLTSRAQGRANSGLNRTSQRRRNGFQGLYRTSMGQEDFTLPNLLFILV